MRKYMWLTTLLLIGVLALSACAAPAAPAAPSAPCDAGPWAEVPAPAGVAPAGGRRNHCLAAASSPVSTDTRRTSTSP